MLLTFPPPLSAMTRVYYCLRWRICQIWRPFSEGMRPVYLFVYRSVSQSAAHGGYSEPTKSEMYSGPQPSCATPSPPASSPSPCPSPESYSLNQMLPPCKTLRGACMRLLKLACLALSPDSISVEYLFRTARLIFNGPRCSLTERTKFLLTCNYARL
jgi:hypothetical protein